MGWLYRKISNALKEKDGNGSSSGLIEQVSQCHINDTSTEANVKQSLCHALQTELTDYYRLIAILETQSFEPLVPSALVDTPGPDVSVLSKGLTLKRLVVWTEDVRLRMRMMGVLIEGCSSE